MAPPAEMTAQNDVGDNEIIEKHGVTTPNRCKQMESRFKQAGRRIRLDRIVPNPAPGATLRFICQFKGEDAEEGYFTDTRYNNPQEYQ